MPIYEYLCLDCNEKFERLRVMNEADNPIQCENCHSQNTSRAISVFFAASGGKIVAGKSSGCANCSTSSCATCKH